MSKTVVTRRPPVKARRAVAYLGTPQLREEARERMRMVNFLRVCMGLDAIPGTPTGYRRGLQLLEALAAVQRRRGE